MYPSGHMVSHHRLIEKIGEGGMGVVYKALDTKLNRHVAIKFLPADLTADPERRLRFQREAQAAAALSHPNIAVIHEVGEHENAPYIVMEYLEGDTLREALQGKKLSTRDWIGMAVPLAEALHHAHERGIVHRDLKPDNVLVTHDGQLKVLDFGLAKLLTADALPQEADREVHTQLDTISKELTVAGKVFGTVHYMSPEQARGEPVDHRSDLFSLGILLYRMAAGKLPFDGKSEIETLSGILSSDLPPMTNLDDEAAADVERIVRKATEKEVERRYQHADDLAADLKNLKRDLDSGRVTMPTPVATPTKSFVGSRSLAGIAILAVLAAVVAWVLNSGTDSTGETPTANGDRVVAVMGFENLADPSDSDNLGRIITGLLNTDLAESGGLRMVTGAKVLATLKEAGAEPGVFDASVASKAAQIAGAQVMVVGQVIQTGDRIILTAELANVATGNTLGSIRKEAASGDEIFTLAGAMADDVRGHLGASEEVVDHDFDLARNLTSSPKAYRHFAAGDYALNNRQWDAAIAAYSRAVEADSTFALAYYRMGLSYTWMNRTEETKASFERALLEGATTLPERWRLVIEAWLRYEERNYDAAYDAVRPLVEAGTDLPDAHYMLGEIYTHAPRYLDYEKGRVALARALELDPTYLLVVTHIFEAYVMSDDAESIRRLIETLRKEDPGSVSVALGEGLLLVAQRKYDQFRQHTEVLAETGLPIDPWSYGSLYIPSRTWEANARIAEQMLQSPAALVRQGAHGRRAFARIFHGRLSGALEDYVAANEPYLEDFGESAYNHSLILLETGDVPGALAAAPRIADEPLNSEIYYRRGSILFRGGKLDEGQGLLDALRRMSTESRSLYTPFWTHMLAAEWHLARGDTAAALAEVEACRAMPHHTRFRRPESLLHGRVLTAAGQNEKAIDAYLEFLEPPYLDQAVANYNLWIDEIPVLYELARLEEATGDLEAARGHYRRYLEHWGEADIPIKNVPDARARLKALER